MQTFLPYPSFSESAKVLDNKRLGKQRVEVYQILRTLSGESKGWINHPAVRMWRGYERLLTYYGVGICYEWISRGFKNSLLPKILEYVKGTYEVPLWLGNPEFHASHRSNLLRKNPDHHYRQFWPDEPDNLSYIWPV